MKLFYPKSKNGLLSDYPELGMYDEFKSLRPHELLFVWYYACSSSPLINIEDDHERILKSIEHCGKTLGHRSFEDKKYLSGDFPEHIVNAIIKMKTFNRSSRARARNMINKILDNYESIVSVDVKDEEEFKNKDGNTDWTKKKAFVDACASIANNLTNIIQLSESGFSMLKSDIGNEDDDDSDIIESYVRSKS